MKSFQRIRLWHLAAMLLALLGLGLMYLGRVARDQTEAVRVFYASGLSPMWHSVRDHIQDDLGITILGEASGSQVAARKLTDLERPCDLIMLADTSLVRTLLSEECTWRLDFAQDEIVIGVGRLAPSPETVEADWATALRDPQVRIARVDERLGPMGYRTLLVWRLAEQQGANGLYQDLLTKTDPVVEHVSQLGALLKAGEVDYAFLYRSLAWTNDIRFIPLSPSYNLGDPQGDYGQATVRYVPLAALPKDEREVSGAPITWTLSVPESAAHPEEALRLVEWLLRHHSAQITAHGFRPLHPPVYFGPKGKAWDTLSPWCSYGGERP